MIFQHQGGMSNNAPPYSKLFTTCASSQILNTTIPYMGTENHIPRAQEDTPDIIPMTCKIHSVTPEIVQQGSWESREYTCVVLRKRDSDGPGQKANIWGSLFLKVDHSDYDGSKYGRSLTEESIQLWRDDMIDSKAIKFFNMTDMVFAIL